MKNMSIKAVAALQAFYGEIKPRFEEDRGAVMAEYGLLLALIAVTLILTITAFKDSIVSVFTQAEDELNKNHSGTP